MAKLKVYRTAIGFHDAYVAAPSQKAALAAWGSDKDLFARDAAELVTDPALTQEPLASPGKVIRKLRGTADEQLAALPETKPPATKHRDAEDDSGTARETPRPRPKRLPAPSRAHLDEAEAALENLAERQQAQLAELAKREAALALERKQLLAQQAAECDRLTAARDEARERYDRAIGDWRAREDE